MYGLKPSRFFLSAFPRTSRAKLSSETVTGLKKLTKYDVTPVELFRISKSPKVVLKEYAEQKNLGRKSYDYVIYGDLIVPSGEYFERPNGMSLRPQGANMVDILENFKGSIKVTILPKGTVIPPDLVLCLEYGDYYSLQTSKACTPKQLNTLLTSFMSKMETISKDQYFDRYSIF